jgi:hypothetical protein
LKIKTPIEKRIGKKRISGQNKKPPDRAGGSGAIIIEKVSSF